MKQRSEGIFDYQPQWIFGGPSAGAAHQPQRSCRPAAKRRAPAPASARLIASSPSPSNPVRVEQPTSMSLTRSASGPGGLTINTGAANAQ